MVSMSAIRDASGLMVDRTLDRRNSQNSSKYQANNAIITELSDKRGSNEVQAPHYAFDMLYCAVVHNLNLRITCWGRGRGVQALAEKVYILSDG